MFFIYLCENKVHCCQPRTVPMLCFHVMQTNAMTVHGRKTPFRLLGVKTWSSGIFVGRFTAAGGITQHIYAKRASDTDADLHRATRKSWQQKRNEGGLSANRNFCYSGTEIPSFNLLAILNRPKNYPLMTYMGSLVGRSS